MRTTIVIRLSRAPASFSADDILIRKAFKLEQMIFRAILLLASILAHSFAMAQDDTDTALALAEDDTDAALTLPQEDMDAALTIIDISSVENASLELEEFLWTSRLIVVFADSPNDPRFIEQMEVLNDDIEPLLERSVTVLTDTNPSTESSIRIGLRPRGFSLILIGMDSGVKLRKPFPWSVREIGRAIDKWPIRQQELSN